MFYSLFLLFQSIAHKTQRNAVLFQSIAHQTQRNAEGEENSGKYMD
jgi:hypothetical protein